MAMTAITTTAATADGGGAQYRRAAIGDPGLYFTWSTTGVYREP
jgi:hypothetical protein